MSETEMRVKTESGNVHMQGGTGAVTAVCSFEGQPAPPIRWTKLLLDEAIIVPDALEEMTSTVLILGECEICTAWPLWMNRTSCCSSCSARSKEPGHLPPEAKDKSYRGAFL